MDYTGYIGTYDSPKSSGIYRFIFNDRTGSISPPVSFYKTDGGKCVVFAGKNLIVTREHNNKAGIALIDEQANVLSESLLEKKTPCFITFHNNMIYTANYHDGTVLLYKIDNYKLQLIKHLSIGANAGCHQVLFWHNLIFVPCLNLDCINIYDTAKDFTLKGKIPFAKGTGPRHGVFSNDEKRFYLVSELSNELFYFELQPDNSWKFKKQLSIVAKSATVDSATAAIRISINNHFLYTSTRGSNLLTVFSISDGPPTCIQQISSAGDHPRDFLLSSNGDYLLVVNRSSNELISMHINRSTGLIENIVARRPVLEGVGIALK